MTGTDGIGMTGEHDRDGRGRLSGGLDFGCQKRIPMVNDPMADIDLENGTANF
jgi:hypothetical protein